MLSKYKVSEPITVFCLAGSGTFCAGKDLEDEQKLVAGTLITPVAYPVFLREYETERQSFAEGTGIVYLWIIS